MVSNESDITNCLFLKFLRKCQILKVFMWCNSSAKIKTESHNKGVGTANNGWGCCSGRRILKASASSYKITWDIRKESSGGLQHLCISEYIFLWEFRCTEVKYKTTKNFLFVEEVKLGLKKHCLAWKIIKIWSNSFSSSLDPNGIITNLLKRYSSMCRCNFWRKMIIWCLGFFQKKF